MSYRLLPTSKLLMHIKTIDTDLKKHVSEIQTTEEEKKKKKRRNKKPVGM